MSRTTTEVLTGTAVLFVAAGFLFYTSKVTGLGAGSGSYGLTASFRSVEGVSVGTDVRLGGVKIGSVAGLALNPETFRADATLAIRKDIILPDDSAVLVSSEGLLGGNFIEVMPGGSPFNLDPGAEILDTQSSVSVVQLLLRFVAGGEGDE